jgi:hypothetical protein
MGWISKDSSGRPSASGRFAHWGTVHEHDDGSRRGATPHARRRRGKACTHLLGKSRELLVGPVESCHQAQRRAVIVDEHLVTAARATSRTVKRAQRERVRARARHEARRTHILKKGANCCMRSPMQTGSPGRAAPTRASRSASSLVFSCASMSVSRQRREREQRVLADGGRSLCACRAWWIVATLEKRTCTCWSVSAHGAVPAAAGQPSARARDRGVPMRGRVRRTLCDGCDVEVDQHAEHAAVGPLRGYDLTHGLLAQLPGPPKTEAVNPAALPNVPRPFALAHPFPFDAVILCGIASGAHTRRCVGRAPHVPLGGAATTTGAGSPATEKKPSGPSDSTVTKSLSPRRRTESAGPK